MSDGGAADDDEALTDDGALTDDERLVAYGEQLADGIEAALPAWVVRCVGDILAAWGQPVDDLDGTRAAAVVAGTAAAADIGPRVRRLLLADIDDQRTNPMAILRGAVVYPTQVLVDAGVPPVVRDADAEAHFPDDLYDLTPGAFADLDPELHDAGLTWGAAKAHVHLARRRRPPA